LRDEHPVRTILLQPPVRVVVQREQAEAALAREIVDAIRARGEAGGSYNLGLATGGTMLGLYRELARLVRAEGLRLDHLRTFNLDEYVGLDAGDPRGFAAFVRRHLFDPLGFSPERARIPDAGLAARDPERAARVWEETLAAAGGIDLQLLGVGRNGHIAFNEPGSAPDSRTRVVELHPWTREDAVAIFGHLERVPRRALTAGVGTILDARALRVLAFGNAKSRVLRAVLRGPIHPDVPASLVREHADVVFWLDRDAAAEVY